ncbi:MAG: sigma-54 interaction domain-containing protein [Thermodesulfovibrionales bacterium]
MINSYTSSDILSIQENKDILYTLSQEIKKPLIYAETLLLKLSSEQPASDRTLSDEDLSNILVMKEDVYRLSELITRLHESLVPKRKPLKKKCIFNGFIGNSPSIKQVFRLVEKISETDSTVLITGESGTGKELIAKIIHFNSERSQGPFVPINCAAIPKDLLESEIFGHEKGAFTGALQTRIGRFELAHKGTIFLDEIGELDPSLQVKLLRILQEREFERVGGIKTIKTDVRILAATNKDLEKATKEGKFREDLYYRINVIPLYLPPLRERTEDIPLLIDYFAAKFAQKRKREALKFTPDAYELMMQYKWPGNVRELENLLERLTILKTDSTVTSSDLPEKFHHISEHIRDELSYPVKTIEVGIPECGIDINSVVSDIERKLILKALEKTGGVKNRAAKILGLNRTTLIEKMKKMGIELKKTVISLPNN